MALILGMVGCTGRQSEFSEKKEVPTVENSSELTWPENKITLTYWVNLSPNAAVAMSSLDEHEVYTEMAKLTNIEMKFIHPAEEKTDFNLMMASNNLPDIIEYNWMNYPGGAQAAIDDKRIISLNKLLDTVAPDAKKAMTATKEIERQTKTDNGNFFAFMPVRSTTWKAPNVPNANTIDTVQQGLIIRKDWLDKLNMKTPENLKDWTNVLTAFRDKMGAKAPATSSGFQIPFFLCFAGCFDTYPGYYQRNGKVVYGPIEDSYKDFLKQMHTWYKEGLLDPDFASNDTKTVISNMQNGKSGVYAAFSSGVQTLMQNMSKIDSTYELMGVPYPDKNDGSPPQFMYYTYKVSSSGYAAISSSCKYPEYAAKYLNYFYTEEGMMLKNFGIKDKSWKIDSDGSIIMTDRINKNPQGYSPQQALGIYSRGDVQTPGYVLKVLDLKSESKSVKNQIETLRLWYKESSNPVDVLIPRGITQTTEEASILSQYTSNVDDFFSTSMLEFIMGIKDIDTEWDNYVKQLKTLGVEQIVKLKQDALTRYLKR
jgi:putative aldouronate transport system substrate-binding protein